MKTQEYWKVYCPYGTEVHTDADKAREVYDFWVSKSWAKGVDGWTISICKVREETTCLESYVIKGEGVVGW